MEKKTEKEIQTAAEKWHLHQAQDLIDSLVRVEEPASKSLSKRAGIPLFGPDDARDWSEWNGPVPTVARVAGDHEARIHQTVLELAKSADREIDFEAAVLRAWKHVLDQGVYCLVLDAGAGEIDKEWILFGEQS